MDRKLAKEILEGVVDEYFGTGYARWGELIDADPILIEKTVGGIEYQIEVSPMWDDAVGGTIRVWYSIDDYGFFSFCSPVTITTFVDSD